MVKNKPRRHEDTKCKSANNGYLEKLNHLLSDNQILAYLFLLAIKAKEGAGNYKSIISR